MLKRKLLAYLEAGIANYKNLYVSATPILAKWKSGVAVLVTLQRQARHHEVPSGQGFTPREAFTIRVLLSSQLHGIRAARSKATDCSNKLGTRRRSSTIIPRCCASDGNYTKEARTNCIIFGVRQACMTKPREHEELVLPDGSRCLPEAACGCLPSATPYRRYNSGVRNACIRIYPAMAGPCSSRTRRVRHGTHAGGQRTTRPEICQRSCKSTAFYRHSLTVAMKGPSNSSKSKLVQANLVKCLTTDLSECVRGIKSLAVLQALTWSLN